MPRAKLSDVSLKQLVAELDRRRSRLTKLVAQRDALNQEIAALQALGVPAAAAPAKRGRKPGRNPAPRPTRGRRGKPLAVYVKEALAAAPKGLAVRAIEKAVLPAGYPTKSKDLYNPIVAVLAKGGFKRVGRGVYALKKM